MTAWWCSSAHAAACRGMSGIEPGGEVDVALMELLDAPNAGAARGGGAGGS